MPMSSKNSLITIHKFKEQEYLIRLEVTGNCMEMVLSDKQIGEEWYCCYDHTYIENLTSKTGNFKTFEVFVKMLKSGLMKISRTTTLNLLTYQELHSQQKTIKPYFPSNNDAENENKQFLILIYTTEFDKIYYPITMDYRGSPNVKSLIATIRRLENELAKSREDFAAYKLKHKTPRNDTNVEELKKQIQKLTVDNLKLTKNLQSKQYSSQKSSQSTKTELVKATSLERALLKLENSVITERKSHQKYVEKMHAEKSKMQNEIETLRRQVSTLRLQLNRSKKSSGISSVSEVPTLSKSAKSCQNQQFLKQKSVNLQQQRNTSRASSKCSRISKTSSGCESLKSQTSTNSRNSTATKMRNVRRPNICSGSVSSQSNASSRARSEYIKVKLKASETDYNALEQRIVELQKKLLSK